MPIIKNTPNLFKILSFLEDLKLKYKFHSSNLFHVNKTGLSTGPSKLFKLIGVKEKKEMSFFQQLKEEQYLLQHIRTVCFYIAFF
jgi:hypothetical protein